MTIAAIKQKLHEYIDTAEDRKLEAIYTMVEGELSVNADLWENEVFLNELKEGLVEYRSGVDKGASWDEVKKEAATLPS